MFVEETLDYRDDEIAPADRWSGRSGDAELEPAAARPDAAPPTASGKLRDIGIPLGQVTGS